MSTVRHDIACAAIRNPVFGVSYCEHGTICATTVVGQETARPSAENTRTGLTLTTEAIRYEG